MAEERVKVFVVDDHPDMRNAIVRFVEMEARVIGTAASPEEALDSAVLPTADVVMVDVSLPRMSGVDLVKALLERHPELRCLMFSGHDDVALVKRALAIGACGFLSKEDPLDMLEGIRRVHGGETYVCQQFRDWLAEDGSEAPSRLASQFRQGL